MKKIMKTLLAATGIISASFGACVLWDGYVQKKEQHKRQLEAGKKSCFIAREKPMLGRKLPKGQIVNRLHCNRERCKMSIFCIGEEYGHKISGIILAFHVRECFRRCGRRRLVSVKIWQMGNPYCFHMGTV